MRLGCLPDMLAVPAFMDFKGHHELIAHFPCRVEKEYGEIRGREGLGRVSVASREFRVNLQV